MCATSKITTSLLVILTLSFVKAFRGKSRILIDVDTSCKGHSRVVLPSKSLIGLGTNSRIICSCSPGGGAQRISFRKRKFFSISGDGSPFIVGITKNLGIEI